MLILWMVYAIGFAAIATGVAIALDQVAQVWGAPRRFVWAAAGAVALSVPVLLATRRAPLNAADAVRTSIDLRAMRAASAMPASATFARASSSRAVRPEWTRLALSLWATASIVLAALLLRSFGVLRRQRKLWRAADVDGRLVLITRDAGPAVVGALRPKIILPSWALDLPDDERALMLAHETEHIRAGDPALLLTAAIALVIVPWNAPLWYLVHRLRLAVELDCDQRVLARERAADDRMQQYGMLLLSVGARRRMALPLTTALAERHPFLERRILAMTALRSSRPVRASIPFAAIAAVATVVAAQTPRPAPLVPARAPEAPPLRSVHLVAPPATPVVAPVPASADAPTIAPPTMDAAPTAASTAIPPIAIVIPDPVPTVRLRAPARLATTPEGNVDVPLDSIVVWVLRQYPSIAQGDTSIDAVSILVDANERFVRIGASRLRSSAALMFTDPGDIASVEVVKGGAAQTMYGSSAANGVITIRTKPRPAANAAGQDSAFTRRMESLTTSGLPGSPLVIVDGVVQNGTPLSQLGVASANLGSMEVVTLRPGLVGPNELHVVIAKLKE